MGVFFTNIHVRAEDRDAVIVGLRRTASLPAFVTKPAAGWVSVYPRGTESKGGDRLEQFAQLLSVALRTTVLGVLVHDSDIFYYVLCTDGPTVDQYTSRAADAQPPEGGDPNALLPFCRPGTTSRQIEQLLRDRTVSRREAPREEQAKVKKEIETKKRRLKKGYEEIRKEIEGMGLPAPSLEQMLRQVDSVGGRMMGKSGEVVAAEEQAAALAALLGLPGLRALRGWDDLAESEPAPGALGTPVMK